METMMTPPSRDRVGLTRRLSPGWFCSLYHRHHINNQYHSAIRFIQLGNNLTGPSQRKLFMNNYRLSH